MNCRTCGAANREESRFCLSCGSPTTPDEPGIATPPVSAALVPKDVLCASCSAPNAPGALSCRSCGTAISGGLSAPVHLEPVVVPGGTGARPTEPRGPVHANATEVFPTTAAATGSSGIRSRLPLLIAGVAVFVAAVVVGVGLIVLRSGSDAEVSSSDRALPAETEASGVAGGAEPAVSDSTVTTTSVPVTAAITPTTSTIAPSTLAPTTAAPVETAPPSAAAVPTVPAVVAPLNSPGSRQVMSDPLPSGQTYVSVQPSFALAQQLADGLALGDWGAVRSLDPSSAGMSDAAFVEGYGGLDRASLMLLDARPSGAGFEVLVVSVALELGGSRTSLYCLAWTADPSTGTVDQGGGSKLTTLQGHVSPEAIRNDPAALAEVGRCIWT